MSEVYELGVTIGTGAFSKVKLATEKATGEQYACKASALRWGSPCRPRFARLLPPAEPAHRWRLTAVSAVNPTCVAAVDRVPSEARGAGD